MFHGCDEPNKPRIKLNTLLEAGEEKFQAQTREFAKREAEVIEKAKLLAWQEIRTSFVKDYQNIVDLELDLKTTNYKALLIEMANMQELINLQLIPNLLTDALVQLEARNAKDQREADRIKTTMTEKTLEAKCNSYGNNRKTLSDKYANEIVSLALSKAQYNCEKKLLERHHARLIDSLKQDFITHWKKFDSASETELSTFFNEMSDVILHDIIPTTLAQRWAPTNWSNAALCLHHQRSKLVAPDLSRRIMNYVPTTLAPPLNDLKWV